MSEIIERVKAAILKALEQSDPEAYIVYTNMNNKTIIDGNFDLDAVASAAIDAAEKADADAVARQASGRRGGYEAKPQTRYHVIRRPAVMEDEGREELIGTFDTEQEAQARIAEIVAQKYWRESDLKIVVEETGT
jgi:hypothetical protein